MATYSSTLAWKIPWTEEPGRLQSMGSQSLTGLSDYTLLASVCVLVAQSCLTLCDPMDYNPPGSSVHRILSARILE